MTKFDTFPLELMPETLLGELERDDGPAPIAGAPIIGAVWYTAHVEGDGLVYTFPAGTLVGAGTLCADMLIAGQYLGVFILTLQEGAAGPRFGLLFSGLNQCSFRIRMPLEAVHQNRWRYDREGAWLKPMCSGDRVDLARVDRLTLTVLRKNEQPVRWCMTPLTATVEAPPRLSDPVLPQGPLLDELGQSTLHDWPAKSRHVAQVSERLRNQLEAAAEQRWPEEYSRWGGWTKKRFPATGFFRTCCDDVSHPNGGGRWWLVDPDGCAFWSSGMDCVRVDTHAAYDGLETALTWMPDPEGEYEDVYTAGETPTINYLAANFIRAFGAENWYGRWATIALAELRRTGFNSVANWSDWQIARQAGFPYVRPLRLDWPTTPFVYRDFPDVFDPRFEQDAAAYAEQLRETANDPAFIGYFLMNEPTWGFAAETPAAGMLFNTERCATRTALADALRAEYGDDDALASAWGEGITFDAVQSGVWHHPLNDAAQADLAAFSETMVEKLFKGLSDACVRVDPNHLNLGVRYYTVP
ncbi:MAG: hypothetical protein JXA89_03620, partial [Anaerolineae bacterium]|nr:hypothetical protein [Anaerolineae bacterium]